MDSLHEREGPEHLLQNQTSFMYSRLVCNHWWSWRFYFSPINWQDTRSRSVKDTAPAVLLQLLIFQEIPSSSRTSLLISTSWNYSHNSLLSLWWAPSRSGRHNIIGGARDAAASESSLPASVAGKAPPAQDVASNATAHSGSRGFRCRRRSDISCRRSCYRIGQGASPTTRALWWICVFFGGISVRVFCITVFWS